MSAQAVRSNYKPFFYLLGISFLVSVQAGCGGGQRAGVQDRVACGTAAGGIRAVREPPLLHLHPAQLYNLVSQGRGFLELKELSGRFHLALEVFYHAGDFFLVEGDLADCFGSHGRGEFLDEGQLLDKGQLWDGRRVLARLRAAFVACPGAGGLLELPHAFQTHRRAR